MIARTDALTGLCADDGYAVRAFRGQDTSGTGWLRCALDRARRTAITFGVTFVPARGGFDDDCCGQRDVADDGACRRRGGSVDTPRHVLHWSPARSTHAHWPCTLHLAYAGHRYLLLFLLRRRARARAHIINRAIPATSVVCTNYSCAYTIYQVIRAGIYRFMHRTVFI